MTAEAVSKVSVAGAEMWDMAGLGDEPDAIEELGEGSESNRLPPMDRVGQGRVAGAAAEVGSMAEGGCREGHI